MVISKTNKHRFHLFSKKVKKSVLFWSQQEIEWVVLWKALIRSSQNIVIILLVFPAVRMSLRDYLRIYSG